MRITDSLTTLGSSSLLLLLRLFVMVVVVVVVESRYYLPEKENVLFYVIMIYVIMYFDLSFYSRYSNIRSRLYELSASKRRTWDSTYSNHFFFFIKGLSIHSTVVS